MPAAFKLFFIFSGNFFFNFKFEIETAEYAEQASLADNLIFLVNLAPPLKETFFTDEMNYSTYFL